MRAVWTPPAASRPQRRAPARRRTAAPTPGQCALSGRDVAGLMLCGDMYGAPYDLLAAFLDVQPDRLRGIVARWRAAGYAADRPARPRAGVVLADPHRPGRHRASGSRPRRPALGRLAHIRAVLAVRLSLEASPAYQAGQAWWRSERRIRAAVGGTSAGGHVPDAEVSWPEMPGSRLPGRMLGHRGRADPQAAGPHRRDHGRAAGPPHRDYSPGATPRPPARAMTGPSTWPPRPRAASSTRAAATLPAPLQRPGDHPRPAARGGAVMTCWAYLRFQAASVAPARHRARVQVGGHWPPSWSLPPRSPSWPPWGWRGHGCAAGRPPGCGGPPRWSLPMTGVYLAGRALQARTWRALALAPVA